MSGVIYTCERCGQSFTVMAGSGAKLCDDCGWRDYLTKHHEPLVNTCACGKEKTAWHRVCPHCEHR